MIGTSRTKYIDPRTVGSTVHSYRGATLADLHHTLKFYNPKKLHCVTIIAGFNDNQASRHEIAARWQQLIDLIIEKFNPKFLIIPKTIATTNNPQLNQKVDLINCVLFNIVENFYSMYTRIFSPTLRLPYNFFCRDGIHFSFFGNNMFAMLLSQMMHIVNFYP